MSQSSLPEETPVSGSSESAALSWETTVAASGPPAGKGYRQLHGRDLRSPRTRRVVLPVFLFLATCVSTFFAGAPNWNPAFYLEKNQAEHVLGVNWSQGLIYMAAVMGILLMHEMGHFVQAARYGVPASLPFFLPVPFLMTGTMGAVISMEGSRANRKQLFDIGLSGPLAGLALALPIIWFGIKNATILDHPAPLSGDIQLGDPLIFKMLTRLLHPGLPATAVLDKNDPLLMAGWVGMLITGLNMLPISQLDGGHVIYGLFGKNARVIARGFLIASILFVIFGEQYNWMLMLVVVILIGVDHPPTRDDDVPLDSVRDFIGLMSLSIPILCFTPVMIT